MNWNVLVQNNHKILLTADCPETKRTMSEDSTCLMLSGFEFSLEIYFQVVHNTVGRYEMPSLHIAIEMLSGKPG